MNEHRSAQSLGASGHRCNVQNSSASEATPTDARIRLLPLAMLFVLSACASEWETTGHPMMTNDQIIAETKKCGDAGLGAWPVPHYGAPITDIVCQPNNRTRHAKN